MNANKRILCVILTLIMCMSTALVAVSAEETADEPNQMYKDIVFEALGEYVNPEYHYYRCEYAYNADGSSVDEGEIPDYILAFVSAEVVHETIINQVIGDYYFSQPHCYYPYDLGYFICSTKDNMCYSLGEAWNAQLPQIEKILAMVGTPVDEVDNDLTRYRKEIISKLGWKDVTENIDYRIIFEYNADGSTLDEGATADYAVIFAHTGPTTDGGASRYFGNYKLRLPTVYDPGYIIYSIAEDKIYSLRQAYNQELPGLDSALEKIAVKATCYADVFEEFLEPYKEDGWEDFEEGWYGYDELYYYSYQKRYGSNEMFEITPDYVLIEGSTYFADPMSFYDVLGDYIVHGGCGFPNCSNYYIYTPKDSKLYTLREAYDAGVKEIEKVFTDFGLGYLTGDADGDRKLTIKDATYIQKCLANYDGFKLKGEIRGHNLSVADDGTPDPYACYIEDFDNNDKVNIKDATAIQKRLAKISE